MCRSPRRRSLAPAGSTRFVSPRDFIWNDDLPVDLDGHGTHVAGTIGQLTNNGSGTAGMAYNVRLMPVKVIQGLWDEIFSSPFEGTDDVVARGVRYAADNGAKVINLSIGREDGGPATAVTDAIRYAVGRGVLRRRRVRQHARRRQPAESARAAGAGHRRHGRGRRGRAHARPRVLFDDRRRMSNSPRPAAISARAARPPASCSRRSISICSKPTTRPVSQYGPPRADSFAYDYFQGTSMATPHVSGFAALLMQQGITEPGGDRSRDETVCDRSRARPAATIRSASA